MSYLPRDAIAALSHQGDVHQAVFWLRRKCDLKLLDSVFAQIPLGRGALSEAVFGELFPIDWKDCVHNRYEPITNTARAIQWHVSIFRAYKDTLQNHSATRDAFVSRVLAAKWQDAETDLTNHQNEHGRSLWALAQYFLLEEERAGPSANKIAREKFSQLFEGHLIGSIAACFSIRAEKTSSLESFELLVRNFCGERLTEDIKTFFHLMLTPNPTLLPRKPDQLLGLLETLSLVDRYELFCRTAFLAVAQNHPESRRFARALRELSEIISDENLPCAAETAAESGNQFTAVDRSLLRIWDHYVEGRYEECAKEAEEFAKSNPLVAQGHELFVKATLYCRRCPVEKRDSPLDSLWHHLFTIFDKGELTEDSLGFIGSLALRVSSISVSWPLMAIRESHSGHEPHEQVLRLAALSQRRHGPRNVEHGFSSAHLRAYLEALKTETPESIAVSFFLLVARSDATGLREFESKIPEPRMLFFKGVTALRDGQYQVAVAKLQEFLDLSRSNSTYPSSPFAVEEARVCIAGALLVLNATVPLQRTVSAAYLDRPHSVRRFPLAKVYRACYATRKTTAGEISFPILAYLACDEPHSISLALKAFLANHGCAKPTDLQAKANEFGKELLATFLIKVCTLDVLDSLLCLPNTAAVEAERIAVLRWLRELQPGWNPVLQSEILRITEAAELREALDWIEASRVAVNLAGIKEAEELKFREAYLRFAAYRELIPHISDIRLQPLGFVGETAVYKTSKEDMQKLISAADSHSRLVRIFADAFEQVRDVFLNSPQFGLDACLSVRIRHGILAQHLRRPFSEQKLFIDPADPRSKELAGYWGDAAGIPASSQPALLSVLTGLSQRILAIIDEVKNSWIQVTTELEQYDPIFTYAYNDTALNNAFKRRDFAEADYSQFLDGIFDELLDRTRLNLGRARGRIEKELEPELAKTLVALEEQLNQFSSAPRYGLLRDAVSRCKSDVEKAVRTMQHWFQGTDAALMEDVAIETAVNTSIGMAHRLFPGVKDRIDKTVSSSFKLQGKYFSGLVHLLFFLIENALRHSGLAPHEQSISIAVRAEDSTLHVEVRNRLADEKNAGQCAAAINQEVASIQSRGDFSKVRSEGGSGLAKIISTLVFEFGSEKYVLAAKGQDHSVLATVEFAAAQIMK